MKRKHYLFIILLILVIGIGYATLSTTLSITGLSKFKKNSWGVHFVNIADNSFNQVDSVQGVISQDRKSIDFEVNFTTPGENYIFYTEVVNDGTIDAMFDNFNVQVAEEAKKLIDVQVTYLDGIEVSKYDLLEAGEKETFKVEISYSQNITASDLPRDGDVDFTVTLSLNYVQSDSNAKVRTSGEQDEASPVISNLRATPGDHSISIDISSYDAYSGIVKYYYSKDGGETYVSSPNPNYVFTDLEDGDYDISVYTEDISGNESTPTTTTVMVSSIYVVLYDDGTLVFNQSGTIDSEKTVLKNYGNIANYKFTYITAPWQQDKSTVTKIDIAERVKLYYGAFLFYDFQNVTEISHMENLDTSRVTDMSFMFSYLTKVENLDVSSLDTSKVTTMESMFNTDSKISYLNVSNWDTTNVENMSSLFGYCFNLTSLDVSSWETKNVTNMNSIFSGLNKVTELNLSTWNTSKVTDMSGMFSGTGITTINISNFDTSNVESMAAMFKEAKVSTLNLGNFDTSKVTDMNSMFESVKNLVALDANSWDVSKVTEMNRMFSNSNFQTLNISNWDVSKVTDMYRMFFYMESLEGIDLSNWDTRNIKDIYGMYSMFTNASKNATSKVWYYGPNSTNLYDNRNETEPNYITLTYKSN